MNKLKKEFKELKKKLSNGEIDQETYSKEVDKLTNKTKIHQSTNLKSNNNPKTIKLTYGNLISTFLFLVILAIIYFTVFYVKKPVEYINSFKNLPSPIQTRTKGNTSITIDEINFNIDFLATYEITGLVVGTQQHLQTSNLNKLSPVDIGLSWGFVADNNDKMSWYIGENRFLNFYTQGTWYTELGYNSFQPYFSHNCLIPSNKTIKKLIKKIETGDYVKLKGYLVNVDYLYSHFNSSTSRFDTDSESSEVIYVTDVTWLKLNKK